MGTEFTAFKAASPVYDQIKALVHLVATMDPAAERAKLDRYLTIASWIVKLTPAGWDDKIVAQLKSLVDAPGGLEQLVEFAKVVDKLLP